VEGLVLTGKSAAEISRSVGIPASTTRELVREIKERLLAE